MKSDQYDLKRDVDEQQEAINNALEELAKVKAYSLTLEELRDFKVAHYALRNLSDECPGFDDNVPELYEARVEVRGNEREVKEL